MKYVLTFSMDVSECNWCDLFVILQSVRVIVLKEDEEKGEND